MVETYSILFKKNNVRVSAGRLSGVDSRVFYLQLQQLLKSFKSVHGEKLADESILVSVDGVEYYRQRMNLDKFKVYTVDDMITHIVDETIEISHILADGVLITNRDKPLSDIYVLELFSPLMYQSEKLKKKKEVMICQKK